MRAPQRLDIAEVAREAGTPVTRVQLNLNLDGAHAPKLWRAIVAVAAHAAL